MEHNTQNYWGFGLFSSSNILQNRNYNVSEKCIYFRPQVGWKTPTKVSPLERADLNH
jgi:hypothetical protein